jgi:hypothetical protein
MTDGLQNIARVLIFAGLIMLVIGGLLLLSGKLPWLGRLPGDIVIQRRNFTFYFPLATSILISILLSLIIWFFSRR